MCNYCNKNDRFCLEFTKIVVSLHRNRETKLLNERIEIDFKVQKGKYQSGQMGQTVNLLSFDFGGSNPSLPTKIAEVAQLIEH